MTLGLRSGTVHLAQSNGEWATAFAGEKTLIASSLGNLPAQVEHIGSTAISSLVAKPILDVMIGRPGDSAIEPYVSRLVSIGYLYRGENGIVGREYFVKDSADGLRTHHLHLVEVGGEIWNSHIAFRDCLRRDPVRAAAYGALKQQLASQHTHDRVAYTDGKAAFIAETLRTASQSPAQE